MIYWREIRKLEKTLAPYVSRTFIDMADDIINTTGIENHWIFQQKFDHVNMAHPRIPSVWLVDLWLKDPFFRQPGEP